MCEYQVSSDEGPAVPSDGDGAMDAARPRHDAPTDGPAPAYSSPMKGATDMLSYYCELLCNSTVIY